MKLPAAGPSFTSLRADILRTIFLRPFGLALFIRLCISCCYHSG